MALSPYGIDPDAIPIAFKVFMHVSLDSDSGEIKVLPPKSKPGEKTVFRAVMDLIVAMTACSAGQSHNFRYKPIDYCVSETA
jgi:uncharacterized protein YcgI (DUF1989 family)